MAGEGILTALQAALAGLGGGIEAAQQYRGQKNLLAAQKQRDEEERVARLAAAQASARAEQRQAVDMGMVSASQYTGINPLDMPGATPRQPLLRQTIGGQEMVLPETKKMVEHRADVMKEKAARAKKLGEKIALGKELGKVEIGGKPLGEETGMSLAGLDSNSRSIALGARRDAARPQRETGGLTPYQQAREDKELAAAEAAFNTAMPRNSPLRQALVTAYNNLRENDPYSSPQELMRSALASTKALKIPLAQPKGKAGSTGREIPPPPGRALPTPPQKAGATKSQAAPLDEFDLAAQQRGGR